MSTTLDTIKPAASPARVGQATAIEQARAVAQVQAMVVVAQQCPRSVTAAIEAMEEACRQYELAQRAFFRFPRAGQTVSGPSVHLARELARCWGNIEHGVTELRRDHAAAESEMQAFAWDLQTNTRSAAIFIVPHMRDQRGGAVELTDMRDIYENNANNGARRLREAIFSVLPVWYRERAMALCTQTLEEGGGKPLAFRIADAVKAFERLRVSSARIAGKFGHDSVDDLTAVDVGQLGVIYESIRQGTVTVDDEFPAEQPKVTAKDIIGGAAAQTASPAAGTPSAESPANPEPGTAGEAPRPPQPASSGQVSMIRKRFRDLGYTDNPDDMAARLRATARLARHDGELASTKNLTAEQAERVKGELKDLNDATELQARLDELAQEAAQQETGDVQDNVEV